MLPLLEVIDPETAALLARTIGLQGSYSPEMRQFANHVANSASDTILNKRFLRKLRAAEFYRRNGLYERSAKLFVEAWNALPEVYDTPEVQAMDDVALDHFSRGRYRQAADRFANAFRVHLRTQAM